MDTFRVKVDQITAGMRLCEAVVNAAGIMLMPSDIRLTPMLIARLKKWGVESVLVARDEQADAAEDPNPAHNTPSSTAPAAPTEQSQFAHDIAVDISRHFVNVREDPLMMQLRSAVIRKLVAHGKEGTLNRMRHEFVNASGKDGG